MLVKKDPLNLTGKVAVITGGSSGIGLGVVELLSAYGAKVAMVDVSPKGEEKAKELCDAGRDVTFYRCDVTNEAQVEETVKGIVDQYGKIDILHNNAGVTVRKTIADLTEKEWDFVLDVGLKGLFYGEEGFRHFFTVKDIAGIDDLKGMKLRVSNDPVMNGLVEGLGASPTVVSFNELYSALQTGVVDRSQTISPTHFRRLPRP